MKICIALMPCLWTAAALSVTGCAPSAEGMSTTDIQNLRNEVKSLKDHVVELQTRVKGLQSRTIKLGADVSQATARYTNASFDPSDPSYQRIDGDLGSFAVSLANVRPFADGVQVTLKLGNLSSATYYGASLTLHYGPRPPSLDDEKYVEKYTKFTEQLKSKEQSITSDVTPGRWNPIQVVLPGIEAKDFGYLDVSISTNKIGLY